MAFHEDWATIRAIAAPKAFTAVKSMITEEKLVYQAVMQRFLHLIPRML